MSETKTMADLTPGESGVVDTVGGEDALHEMIPDKLPPEIKAIYDNAHSD